MIADMPYYDYEKDTEIKTAPAIGKTRTVVSLSSIETEEDLKKYFLDE